MDSPSFGTFFFALGRDKQCCKLTGGFTIVLLGFGVFNCWWFLVLPHQEAFPITSVDSHNTIPIPINGSSRDSSSMPHQPEEASTILIDGSNGDNISIFLQQEEASPPLYAPSQGNSCDLTRGRWISDSTPPLYTNDTCKYILPNQNCMMNGRPDRDFLYWKWKPVDCELQPFNPKSFLEMMRGKRMVFIGDSIARNQMQALLCALSQVDDPTNLYNDGKEKEYTWGFPYYNFTLANSWSPFLVNHSVENDIYKIHLDQPDMAWSLPFANYDVAIISTGYWYFRPSIYYMNNTILGSNPRSGLNLTEFDMLPAMKIALGTVLRHMVDKFNGITIMRTITVPHFENGSWGNGGSCNRTEPYADTDMKMPLPWMSNAMYNIQMEEYMKVMVSKDNGLMPRRLKVLDVTYSALLRPDGHPGPYRIQKPNEPVNDCLHWCLPGPIDMWSQLLTETIKPYFHHLA